MSPGQQALPQEPDKVDLEKHFMERLRTWQPGPARATPARLSRIGKDLYVADGGCYESESVRNVSFFYKDRQTYIPVRDTLRPVESITTLLTGYTGDSEYIVHLLQHRYNYETVEVDVPLAQLLGCCLDDGFVPYVGIEATEGETYTASLFLVNEPLGFCHTFTFTIERSVLPEGKGTLAASGYTYTPIHNLRP